MIANRLGGLAQEINSSTAAVTLPFRIFQGAGVDGVTG